MKVQILTIADIKISPFRWWSNWIDIAIFDHGYTGYLLQMKISRTNSKRFKTVSLKGLLNIAPATINQAGDLTQMVES